MACRHFFCKVWDNETGFLRRHGHFLVFVIKNGRGVTEMLYGYKKLLFLFLSLHLDIYQQGKRCRGKSILKFYVLSSGKYAPTPSKSVLSALKGSVTLSHYSPWIFLTLNGAFTFLPNFWNYFDVLLTVNLSLIFVINQLNAQIIVL